MHKRVVIDRRTTPQGKRIELAIEREHHIIRVDGVPLMSSEMRGSEEAMAELALEELGEIDSPRILVGGLGMGFTLRAVLDAFGEDAEVTVAELLHDIVGYNRGVLADLAGRPLEDPRVELLEGDVHGPLKRGGWDVILMDVDNGPLALTADGNQRLYDTRGVQLMARALEPGGVLVVWSAYPSPAFLERLRKTGLSSEKRNVRGGWPLREGPMHTLFIATKPDF